MSDAVSDPDAVCRCGHTRSEHDKVNTDLVYGWCGECLKCDCPGFIDRDDDDLATQARRALDEWYTGAPGPDKVVMYAENLIGELRRVEAEVARLEREGRETGEAYARAYKRAEAAEARIARVLLVTGKAAEVDTTRLKAAEAEYERQREYADEQYRKALAAEAENARLRDGQDDAIEAALLSVAQAMFPDFDFSGCYDADDLRNHMAGQAATLREEVSRLRDGLRIIAERCESEMYADEEQAVYASQEARALLAEDADDRVLAELEERERNRTDPPDVLAEDGAA